MVDEAEVQEDIEVIEARAAALVASHRELLQALISMRATHDLTQDQVADRMGVSQSAVSQFERYDANPRLSTLRRYALAVGARIEHTVTDDYQSRAIEAETASPPLIIARTRQITIKTPVNWGSSHFTENWSYV